MDTNSLKHPDHPVWVFVVLGFLTLFTWLNCSNFDFGEMKTIGSTATVMLGLLGGAEGLKKWLARQEQKSDVDDRDTSDS